MKHLLIVLGIAGMFVVLALPAAYPHFPNGVIRAHCSGTAAIPAPPHGQPSAHTIPGTDCHDVCTLGNSQNLGRLHYLDFSGDYAHDNNEPTVCLP